MTLLVVFALVGVTRADTRFLVRDVQGKEIVGQLKSLDERELVLRNEHALPAASWLTLRQPDVPLPAFPTAEHLILANGDRIPVRELRMTDEKVAFTHPDLNEGKEVPVPLSSVAMIWRLPPTTVTQPQQLRRRLLQATRSRDLVLLRNGDTIEGTLQSLKVDQVEMEVNKKALITKWPQVSAIAMSTELLTKARPKGTFYRLTLAGHGGRFTVTHVTSEGKRLCAKTSFGSTLNVPIEQVVALDQLGEQIVELSDLKTPKYEYTPYLNEQSQWRTDAAVTGSDLLLDRSTYTRGLGMPATSKLTFALDGQYQRFDTLVGLDNQTGNRGAVQIRVLVDGKPMSLAKKETWTHRDRALSINLDVKGAKELTLEVVRDANSPVQGVVNWVNPRLVK